MSDQGKTKEQLIGELAALQQRVAELEATESKHKRMQEAFTRSEERFRIIFELAPDAYYLSDLQGTFLDGNQAAEELVGYERGELIGKNFLRLGLLPPGQVPKAVALLARNVLGKRTGPDEFTLNRRDGTQVTVEISTHPVRIGDRVMVLGIARDISERKQAEDERERLIARLREALAQVETLGGLLPICASCKKIRDDQGYWHQVETYIQSHSDAEFTHGICPDCFRRLYPEFVEGKE
jgi:PAS domain S-box-containing protein